MKKTALLIAMFLVLVLVDDKATGVARKARLRTSMIFAAVSAFLFIYL